MAKPKLHVYIPSLPQRSYEYRRGDSVLIYDDDKAAILIDGGQGEYFTKMESFMKTKKIQHVCFVLTHWHNDHDCGLKAALNSGWIIVDEIYAPDPAELKLVPRDDGYSEYNRAVGILKIAKDLKKKIIYPAAGKRVGHWVGKIRMWMWRQKASASDYVDYQVNNTSIQTYFPDLQFLSGGDIISGFEKYLKKFPSYKITGFKIPHHGNACAYSNCDLLTERGAKICFYNDWEPKGVSIGGTNFSKYGAGRCKQYFTTLRPFTDIYIDADGEGHVTWKQGANKWVYDANYGRTSTKQETKALQIVSNTGFKGYNVSTRKVEIQYIVIHYTGNDGATAAENVAYFNGGDRGASADYFVNFDGKIYEYNPDVKAQYSWHCGGELESTHHPYFRVCMNKNSIGIELCTKKVGSNWTFDARTVSATVELVKSLMSKYGISASNVIRHYDVTGKACPRVSGWGAVGGDAEWQKFKAVLTGSSTSTPQIYRVRKSWADASSQLGAFSSLENAKTMAAKHPGYSVYDSSGKAVS